MLYFCAPPIAHPSNGKSLNSFHHISDSSFVLPCKVFKIFVAPGTLFFIKNSALYFDTSKQSLNELIGVLGFSIAIGGTSRHIE